MKQTATEIIFINVKTPSEGLIYVICFVMFGITPIAIMLLVFKIFQLEEFHLTIPVVLISIVAALVLLLLVATFRLFRHHAPHRIITSEKGLKYSSILRNVLMRWDEIIAIKPNKGLLGGKSFQLRSGDQKLNVPIYMKEKDNPFPKLSIINNCWLTGEHAEMALTVENCPLYIEIQKYLQAHLTDLTADRD